MIYIVTDNGREFEMTLDEIKQKRDQGALSPRAKARVGHQSFDYDVAMLLSQSLCPTISFLCVKCRKMVTARYVDMQLQVPCSSCGQKIFIPDKRSAEEKASSQDRREAKSEYGYRIFMGAFLLLACIGLALLKNNISNPDGWSIGGLEKGYLLMVLSGFFLLTSGVKARHAKKMEAKRTKHPPQKGAAGSGGQ